MIFLEYAALESRAHHDSRDSSSHILLNKAL